MSEMIPSSRVMRILQRRHLRLLVLPLAILAGACSTVPLSPAPDSMQQIGAVEHAALQQLVTHQDRLYRVAGPLLVENAQLCKDNARNLLGFTAKNRYSYSESLIEAAETLLGLGEKLQVVGVLPGSGAARAGLRPGDRLLRAEGQAIPEGANAEREAAALLAPMVAGRSALNIAVLRKDDQVTLAIPLTHACAFPIEIGNSEQVNAYNDGRHIMVTKGMMNFTQSDDELAYVIARELAHNVLKHASKQKLNGAFGTVIAHLRRMEPDSGAIREAYSRIRPFTQEMDGAADRLALYMLARAGYNLDNAQRFWERLALSYPSSASASYTALHPATSHRLSVISKTVAEIKDKKLARKPLVP